MNATSVLVLAGQKGGTGKTTTAVSLACEAHFRTRRTLLVDTDPQASARTWIGVGARSGADLPPAVSMGSELRERGQLDALSREYELVIIDCPSRIEDRSGAIMRSALLFAAERRGTVVLPCGPSAMDVWALSESIDAVRDVQGLMPGLRGFVLVTRKSPQRTVLGENARAALRNDTLPVLNTELCHRIHYQESSGSGRGVTQYAPQSTAAAEMRALYSELWPLIDTSECQEGGA